MDTASKNKLGYFGHHKCASTWIQYLISAVSKELALRHVVLASPSDFRDDFGSFIRSSEFDFFSYTNANWEAVSDIADSMRGFHLIRDPRDMVVSAYFSHKLSHPSVGWPELDRIRENLNRCSLEEGLKQTIDNLNELPILGRSLRILDDMANWNYDHPNMLEIRYEDMVASPYDNFLEILEWLKLCDLAPFGARAQLRWSLNQIIRKVFKTSISKQIPIPIALAISRDYSFKRISGGRRSGKEDRTHHFRKGQAGDWKEYFTPVIVDYFKDQTGDLLVRLNYEKSSQWSL